MLACKQQPFAHPRNGAPEEGLLLAFRCGGAPPQDAGEGCQAREERRGEDGERDGQRKVKLLMGVPASRRAAARSALDGEWRSFESDSSSKQ